VASEFIARVVEEQRGRYRLSSGNTEHLAVLADRRRTGRNSFGLFSDDPESLDELAERLRHRQGPRVEIPVVGDWVRAVADAPGARAVIHGVLPRRSRIARRAAGNPTEEQVLAANVDIAFIVSSLNRELSPARLAR
jgi:ribosome biogenesis GTPase / thiamine phosphate phosphatase